MSYCYNILMSSAHHHEHEPEIEGLPLGRPIVARRELAPEASLILEYRRRIQREEEQNEQLRYLAYHDNLTGLPNARAFQEAFEGSVGEALIKDESIGLVIGDLDGLKYANDTLGHDKGDELIKVVSNALATKSREKDVVFRIGGDEFAILL